MRTGDFSQIAVDISKWNQKKVEMETPTPVDDAHPDVSKPTVFDHDKKPMSVHILIHDNAFLGPGKSPY